MRDFEVDKTKGTQNELSLRKFLETYHGRARNEDADEELEDS